MDIKINSPYHLEDPMAKVVADKIYLSWAQKIMFKDKGFFYITDEQQKIMDKYVGKKLSVFPEGWDAFYRPDLIWEYVYDEPAPKEPPPTKEEQEIILKKSKELYAALTEVIKNFNPEDDDADADDADDDVDAELY